MFILCLLFREEINTRLFVPMVSYMAYQILRLNGLAYQHPRPPLRPHCQEERSLLRKEAKADFYVPLFFAVGAQEKLCSTYCQTKVIHTCFVVSKLDLFWVVQQVLDVITKRTKECHTGCKDYTAEHSAQRERKWQW